MKFTIGLPITKTKYLKQSLESIDNQTFNDYEVIIRNNAKTSELKAEIKDICKHWITRKNVVYEESVEQLSMPVNFNKIFEKAKGEFFTILSDDDVIDHEFLSEIDALTKKYTDTKVFHCRVKLIDGEGDFLGITENCPEWETQEDFIFQRINEKRIFYLSDFVANSEALRKIKGFNEKTSGWGVDEITWSNLAYNGIGFSNKLLLNYRFFPGNFSLSSENLRKRFEDIQVMHKNFDRIIKEKCSSGNSIYPLQYMLDLNEKRTQTQNDLVFNFHTRSENFLKNIKFYFLNRSKLKTKVAFKNLVKSLF